MYKCKDNTYVDEVEAGTISHLEDEDGAFLVFAVAYQDLVEEGIYLVVVFLQYTVYLILRSLLLAGTFFCDFGSKGNLRILYFAISDVRYNYCLWVQNFEFVGQSAINSHLKVYVTILVTMLGNKNYYS